MLDISKMNKEQLLAVKQRAKEALKDYSEDPIGKCYQGYNILRYAKAGLYEVKQ